jgi:glycosyltransferase 2 family protein
VLVLSVGVGLRAGRWWLLFAAATRPPLPAVTRALLVGYLFNNILPARAGEIARIVVLHRETRTSRAEALATAVAERFYDVIALILLLLVASPFLPDISWLGPAVALGTLVLVVLVGIVAVIKLYGSRPLRFAFKPLTRFRSVSPARVDELAESVVRGLAAVHRPRLAVPAFAVTIFSWLVVAVSFWAVVAAFDLGVGFDAALLMLIATNLAMLIPSLPAALGVFEAACLVALRAFGVPDSEALSCIVVLHVVNFVPFLAAGYVALTWHARVRPAVVAKRATAGVVEEPGAAAVRQVYR